MVRATSEVEINMLRREFVNPTARAAAREIIDAAASGELARAFLSHANVWAWETISRIAAKATRTIPMMTEIDETAFEAFQRADRADDAIAAFVWRARGNSLLTAKRTVST